MIPIILIQSVFSSFLHSKFLLFLNYFPTILSPTLSSPILFSPSHLPHPFSFSSTPLLFSPFQPLPYSFLLSLTLLTISPILSPILFPNLFSSFPSFLHIFLAPTSSSSFSYPQQHLTHHYGRPAIAGNKKSNLGLCLLMKMTQVMINRSIWLAAHAWPISFLLC